MTKMKALITGANGFVGKYLSQALTQRLPEIQIVSLATDLRDRVGLLSFLREIQPDQVFHLAAQPFVPLAMENPWETEEINVAGTLTLLEGLHRNQKPCRFLYVSSADVYGKQSENKLPFSEELLPNPINPYSGSKLSAESYCRQYSNYSPYVKVVIARPFNHIGAGQRKEFVVPNFCYQIKEAISKSESHIFVGDLSPTRDFSHVQDIVEGYILLMQKGNSGEIYNICSGEETSIEFIVKALIGISGQDLRWEVDPSRVRSSEANRVVGNNTKIRALGWTPKFKLSETLQEIYRSIQV